MWHIEIYMQIMLNNWDTLIEQSAGNYLVCKCYLSMKLEYCFMYAYASYMNVDSVYLNVLAS